MANDYEVDGVEVLRHLLNLLLILILNGFFRFRSDFDFNSRWCLVTVINDFSHKYPFTN